ncbi:MAG: hypothetical protein CMO55_27775 [Verrucomicrobiales bacterium]|nr:hypothetical protein [Verrucomicrobiales bacterium]
MACAFTKVVFVSRPVGVAPDVHEVATPAFSIARAGEKFVDFLFVVWIGGECADFFWCGSKAGKVDCDTAKPGLWIGFGAGSESEAFVLGGNETVDFAPWP